jgi:protein SCO1
MPGSCESGRVFASLRTDVLVHFRAVCVMCVAIGGLSSALCAEDRMEPLPPELKDVGVDERAGEQLPLELAFLNDRGQTVTLRQCLRTNRPAILSLNYSNCPLLCSQQLNGLIASLQKVDWAVGNEFDVISVSIDPLETPERAALTKQKYVELYGRRETAGGWKFLVGSSSAITRIADAVGFRYQYLRDRREYSHPAVFVMVTPEGRISRYVYGIEFAPQDMKLSLVEASEGKIGTTWDRILLFCLHYDNSTGKYSLAASRLMRAGGVVTLLAITALVGVCFWRERRRARTGPSVAGPPSGGLASLATP